MSPLGNKRRRYASAKATFVVIAWYMWKRIPLTCQAIHDLNERAAAIPRIYRKPVIRVINGQNAPDYRYTYAQVSLILDVAGSSSKYGHQCGGSIVASDMILTAGHCRHWFRDIQIDRFDFANASDAYDLFKAKNVVVHPLFEADTYRNDFMLIQLDRPFESTTPVRLNSNPFIPLTPMELTVIGWGTTDNSDPDVLQFPSTLQRGNVQYITNDDCESIIVNNKTLYTGEIFPEMLCANSHEGVDACAGDSGGPLISEGQSEGLDLLVGLVSWGRGCAIYPGVYSRISSGYDWIRHEICFMSIDPPPYLACTDNERDTKYRPTDSPSIAIPITAPSSSSTQIAPSESPTRLEQSLVTPPASPVSIAVSDFILTVEIQLDTSSDEIGWTVVSEQGKILRERSIGIYTYQPNGIIFEEIELPSNDTYTFSIVDSAGDGICCSKGNIDGWFKLSLKQILVNRNKSDDRVLQVIIGNGDFGQSYRAVFSTVAQYWHDLAPSPLPTSDKKNRLITGEDNSSSSKNQLSNIPNENYVDSSVSCRRITLGVKIVPLIVAMISLF